jgi:hypothetical protein
VHLTFAWEKKTSVLLSHSTVLATLRSVTVYQIAPVLTTSITLQRKNFSQMPFVKNMPEIVFIKASTITSYALPLTLKVSISPTFQEQLLRIYFCAKKLQI